MFIFMLNHSVIYDSLLTHGLQHPRLLSVHGIFQGVGFPSLGDLPDPEAKPVSPASPALAGRFFTTEPWEALALH